MRLLKENTIINSLIESLDDTTKEEYASYLYDEADGDISDIPNYERTNDYIFACDKREYKEIYSMTKTAIENVADNLYSSDHTVYIELSARPTMNYLSGNVDNVDPEQSLFTFEKLRDEAFNKFQEETGVEVWQAGRSGRHIVVEDNFYNAYHYNELCAAQEKWEDWVVEEFSKAYPFEGVNESLEEDGIKPINPDDKDYANGNLMRVCIWSGAGYSLDTFYVYATSAEAALELVVAYCEKNSPNLLMSVDEIEKFVKEDFAEELANYTKEDESDDWFGFAEDYLDFVYIDATMEGASKPYFIRGENLRVEDVNDIKESLKEGYMGVDGAQYIDRGNWSDGAVRYRGFIYNAYEIQQALGDYFEEELKDAGKEIPTDNKYFAEFDKWIKENPDKVKSEVSSILYDFTPESVDPNIVSEVEDEYSYKSLVKTLNSWKKNTDIPETWIDEWLKSAKEHCTGNDFDEEENVSEVVGDLVADLEDESNIEKWFAMYESVKVKPGKTKVNLNFNKDNVIDWFDVGFTPSITSDDKRKTLNTLNAIKNEKRGFSGDYEEVGLFGGMNFTEEDSNKFKEYMSSAADRLSKERGKDYAITAYDILPSVINWVKSLPVTDKTEAVTESKPELATKTNSPGKVRNYLNYELEDDDTETGGISFDGETVADFIADADIKEDDDLDTLNKALVSCGIRPIAEGYLTDYRGDDYWKLSDVYQSGDLSDRELAWELVKMYDSHTAAERAFKEITDGKEMPSFDDTPKDIEEVSPEEIHQLVMEWSNQKDSIPRGRYIAQDGDKWVVIDNRTGNCWTEEFNNRGSALDYLEDLREADGTKNNKSDKLYDLYMDIVGKLSNEDIEKLGNSLIDYVKNDV